MDMVIESRMAESARHTIRIDRQGRALIPKPLREAMGMGDGGEAVAWLEEGRLVVEPRDLLLRRLKDRYREVAGSMAEELIRERRQEAAREEQG
jgi:bifunctional DNA-binding transcriptional regulator/antitoxin component of YhaV-PrlF toxin-antitoxin module